MSTVVNKSAPGIGGAIGYFVVTAYLIPNGYLDEKFVAEGVVMAGIVSANIVMELKVFFSWLGSLFSKKEEE